MELPKALHSACSSVRRQQPSCRQASGYSPVSLFLSCKICSSLQRAYDISEMGNASSLRLHFTRLWLCLTVC